MRRLIFLMVLFIPRLLTAQSEQRLVDSLLRTMSLQEKVSQLFALDVSAKSEKVEEAIANIRKIQPGVVLFNSGGLTRAQEIIEKTRRYNKAPILFGIRSIKAVDSAILFPSPILQAASDNDSLVYLLARFTGQQLKSAGIGLLLGINADADFPTGNSGAFANYLGNDKQRVTRMLSAMVTGFSEIGIRSVVSHLPGEYENSQRPENTEGLPKLSLDTLSLFPFLQLASKGVAGINTAHLHFTLTGRKSTPAPIAQFFLTDLIRTQLNYKGLLITESNFLESLTGKKRGEAEKLAFTLGYDLILGTTNPSRSIRKITRIVKRNEQAARRLDESVKRILQARVDQHPAIKSPASISNYSAAIARTIEEQAVTVWKNDSALLPVRNLENRVFRLFTNDQPPESFLSSLGNYIPFKSIKLGNEGQLISSLGILQNDVSVFLIESSDLINDPLLQALSDLDRISSLVIVYNGNPTSIHLLSQFKTVLTGYTRETFGAIAQVIFGAQSSRGNLPVRYNGNSTRGIITESIGRLSYGVPEMEGMSTSTLDRIDQIAAEAIDGGATPGCRVLVARNGRVVLDKSYGFLTYEKKNPVTRETIYDLASVTKVLATLQSTVYLYDQGFIDVYKKASVYLPELDSSNKRNFTLKDILTHQAGLWPYLPFWSKTMSNGLPSTQYYASTKSDDYPFPVADKLFAGRFMKDSLWTWIINAKISEKKERAPFDYKYSDMGFYILQRLSERILKTPMETFLQQKFFDPLGMTTTGYLPLQKFDTSQIAPTENDQSFRKSLLTGYVHDQGAAMHGGIAGHAGLFSTANDLAKIGQMWLQYGYYGGRQYFGQETVKRFTSRQFLTSRRGLGWDKPLLGDPAGPTSVLASAETFGHTGFTGTCIWADPATGLLYIFLSNRVHPDMNNSKLLDASIRPRIHDLAYQAILNFKGFNSGFN